MDITEARKKAVEVFGDVKGGRKTHLVEVTRGDELGEGFFEQMAARTPLGFPFPGLLLFGFKILLGLESYGPEEKMRWGVAFKFKAHHFAFELRKFGLRFLCERQMQLEPLTREALGRAKALVNVVEAFLSSGYIDAQVANGSITVANIYPRLDERYQYLRAQALIAYSRPPRPPERGNDERGGSWFAHDVDRPLREGGALASATVDAYFSRLEHLFALATAFVEGALTDGGLVEFLNAPWVAKARLLLPVATDPGAQYFCERFRQLRELWRNPLAHGGFLRNGESFHFHLPGIGALPAQLTRTPQGVKAAFTMESESFANVIALFDEFDTFLAEGPLRHPVKWIVAELDVAFDPASREAYRAAMKSDGLFQILIDQTEYRIDQHVNMDY